MWELWQMKYFLCCKNSTKTDKVEYTLSVLRHLAVKYGHQIVNSIPAADAILYSACDPRDFFALKKVAEQSHKIPIIVGGHAAVYWKLWLLAADCVYLGEAWDFFQCSSLEEIFALPCVAISPRREYPIIASHKVLWRDVPMANVAKRQKYYWGGIGCKNKCKFCLTSWTHKPQTNPYVANVQQKHPNVTIVTNDSASTIHRMTQSMMVKDFLAGPLKKYAVYRLGVEFATEETRRKYGKPFSDDAFVSIFEHAARYGARLKLFCIAGIDQIEEWEALFEKVPHRNRTETCEVKFTNLTVEMFTPLSEIARDVFDPKKLLTSAIVRQFVLKQRKHIWALRPMPLLSPVDTLRRMCLAWSTSEDDVNLSQRLAERDLPLHFMEHLLPANYSSSVVFGLKSK
jgi:hypothetical protein